MGILYFGHLMNTYGTELEKRLLRHISEAFPDWAIENPNQKHHQEGYARWKKRTGNGMDYFTKRVLPNCHGGIFLPFRDGAWGAGVFREAKFYAERKYPIWTITFDGIIDHNDTFILSGIQPLSVEEAIARIRTGSGQTMPY